MQRTGKVQTCTKCNAQSPDEAELCANCGSDLKEWSKTAVARKKFANNPRVRYVQIITMDNCCPACHEMHGSYAKDSAPVLPVEGCSHPLGCRCFYQPVLDEIYP
jgi:ribosomal protein L40E